MTMLVDRMANCLRVIADRMGSHTVLERIPVDQNMGIYTIFARSQLSPASRRNLQGMVNINTAIETDDTVRWYLGASQRLLGGLEHQILSVTRGALHRSIHTARRLEVDAMIGAKTVLPIELSQREQAELLAASENLPEIPFLSQALQEVGRSTARQISGQLEAPMTLGPVVTLDRQGKVILEKSQDFLLAAVGHLFLPRPEESSE